MYTALGLAPFQTKCSCNIVSFPNNEHVSLDWLHRSELHNSSSKVYGHSVKTYDG